MREPAKRRRQHAPRGFARRVHRAHAQHKVALRIGERLQRQERHVEIGHHQIAKIIQHPDGDFRALLLNRLRCRGDGESLQHLARSTPQHFQFQFLDFRQRRVRETEIHAHELLLLGLQIEGA